MSIKSFLRSFAGGELAPELYGRPDLLKFQTGFSPNSKNVIVRPHGPVANRPGFEYVIETKDSTKESVLIPFAFSNAQTYILEFGDQYVRIHTRGGTLLEAAQSITNIVPGIDGWAEFQKVGHGYTSGQWLYLSDVAGMTELNGRYIKVFNATSDTFTATDLAGNQIDVTGYGAFTGGNMARVFEIASPYLEADLFDLHFTQSADVLTVVHPSYQQRELRRHGATNWSFSVISFSPTIATPSAPNATGGGTAGGTPTDHQYRVTALAADGLEESLGSDPSAPVSRDLSVAGSYIDVDPTSALSGTTTYQYSRTAPASYWYVASNNDNAQLYWNGTYAGSTPKANTAYSIYSRSTLMATTTREVTEAIENYKGQIEYITYTVTEDWYQIGQADSAPVEGAVRYNVYKLFNGLWGYIGQTDGSVLRDNNITPDTTRTPPEANDPFVGAGNYPGAVGYFQGRRWFAGTNNRPQNLWGTRSGTESNMSYSIPTRDDDSIAIRLTSRQANTIRHIVPLSDLLLLTSGGEWKIDSGGAVGPVTPSTIDPRPEDYIGASNVTPVIANGAVLYPEGNGGHVMELKYTWEAQGYKPQDVSVMAPHLFDDYNIVSMAYTRKPYKALWAVRSDGALLGLTYVPEHQVTAWHHHDTDGTFESVAAVREGTEDMLYAIVRRTINGRNVRYLERMHSRVFDTLADAFFVDAGATYSGPATTTINGLWHLEGKTVAVLADGAVQPRKTVVDGKITLDNPSSKVHIGLPYNADLETLPLAMETEALAQATRKNVNKVYLRVHASSGIAAGPSFDKLTLAKQRTTENYGEPPALRTGLVPITISPKWGDDGTLCVRQSDPLPLTILGLVPDVA